MPVAGPPALRTLGYARYKWNIVTSVQMPVQLDGRQKQLSPSRRLNQLQAP